MKDSEKINVIHFGSSHQAFFQNLIDSLKGEWSWKQGLDNKLEQAIMGNPARAILIFDQDYVREPGWLDIVLETRKGINPVSVLMIVAADKQPPDEFDELIEYLDLPLNTLKTTRALIRLAATLEMKKEIQLIQQKLQLHRQELTELNQIGIALSIERDPDALLEKILFQARKITSADAGSLYLVEKNPDSPAVENNFWADKQLRFKLAHNDSLEASYSEFVMPVAKKSIAGYTALASHPVNIDDAYQLPQDSPFQHNRSFDEKMGYITKSVLCIPMTSHQGEMIGVLQLINRKRNWAVKLTSAEVVAQQIIPFDQHCIDLASSLASQAAVSIENMRLYEEIKHLFERFIVASSHAIEQRDPTTSGHSTRVAEITVALAQKLDGIDRGPYKGVKFSGDDIQQINYAALLHDFGKIGVREHVLIKEKKLYPEQLQIIKYRFKFIKKVVELLYSRKKLDYLFNNDRKGAERFLASIDHELKQQLEKLDSYLEFILQANEPKVLAEGGFEKLKEISELTLQDNGELTHFLTEDEVDLLSIPRGTLNAEERLEIESHVNHTYNFLTKLKWPTHLKSVPQIAQSHHEKLNGEGYPNKLSKDQIPLPARMMAIADIYDALTAWDRPYKKAMPTERALSILKEEVELGCLDSELFRLFVEDKIYALVAKPE